MQLLKVVDIHFFNGILPDLSDIRHRPRDFKIIENASKYDEVIELIKIEWDKRIVPNACTWFVGDCAS